MQYSGELYAQLEEETGLSAGYKQCGGVIVARTEDRMTQLRRTAATADAFGLECSLLTPDEAQQRWPDAGRGPGRGDLAARRRQGQPDRPDHGARQRRPDAGGPGLRAHPGGRRAQRPGCGDRRPHRPGRHRGRGRRQLRRAVGGPGRRDGRGAGAAALRRALLRRHRPDRGRAHPTCRSCATRTAGPTSRRRSAAWSSAASSRRPSPGSRRTGSPTRSSSRCWRRTGTTSRC